MKYQIQITSITNIKHINQFAIFTNTHTYSHTYTQSQHTVSFTFMLQSLVTLVAQISRYFLDLCFKFSKLQSNQIIRILLFLPFTNTTSLSLSFSICLSYITLFFALSLSLADTYVTSNVYFICVTLRFQHVNTK